MAWYVDTAAVTGAVGLVTGLLVPDLIRRIPEPRPGDPPEGDTVAADAGPPEDAVGGPVPAVAAEDPVELPEPKEPYAAIAARRGLRWRSAVASGLAAALVGAAVGWSWSLLFLLYLVPVGVALAVVDWRTRLLPTKVIAPSYFVVALLAVAAAALGGDFADLRRAFFGWLVGGGTFVLLWLLYPRGMGYGDVRLSGVLGIGLGFLGWAELLTGVYAGFLLGGVGGLLLSALRLVDRRAYPFGPFMLLGALVGVLLGEPLADLYLAG